MPALDEVVNYYNQLDHLLEEAKAQKSDQETLKAENVLSRALDLIYGQRNSDYGPPLPVFQDWANAVNGLLRLSLSPQDLAVIMILLKLIRLKHSAYAHEDSLLDAAGYVGLLDRLKQGA